MRVLWTAAADLPTFLDGDFGPNPFAPPGPAAELRRVAGRRKGELKAQLKASCPRTPGVYGMVDGAGRLVYVGKSKTLRARLFSYFGKSARGEKGEKILRDARTLVWEETGGEFAALLRELQLIRTWRPKWNVKDQPRGRRPRYLCVGRGPARCLFVTTNPPKHAVTFGPVHGRGRLTRAVEALNEHFGLRDCTAGTRMHFADQTELFPAPRRPGCLRLEIGTCLGPCAAGCTRRQYADRVRAALRFLRGEEPTRRDGPPPSVRLAERMAAAAADRRFETAAKLRDRLAAVEWLDAKLADLRDARERFHFVYPAAECTDGGVPREVWYVIEAGQVVAALHSPRADGRRRGPARRLLETWVNDGRLHPAGHHPPHPTVNLTSHWFRTREGELDRVLSPADALALCRRPAPR